MEQCIDGLTVLPQHAEYMIMYNDEEYYAKDYNDAITIYNKKLNNKIKYDLLKMFKYEKMPCDDHRKLN